MSGVEEIYYTEDEIRSYLPSGWNLADDALGVWNPGKHTWTATVIDEVDFDWPVVVAAREVAEKGRIEALRGAVDRTYRDRLGRPTRGLGLFRGS